MANVAAKFGVKTLSIVIGIPVGILSKKAVERVWHATRPDDPPRAPTDPNVSWRDAMVWAGLSAAGVAAAQLVATKAAASIWRTLTGQQPPSTSEHKDKNKTDAA